MFSDQLVAIISAGGSGIGLSIAQSLHELGYRLFIVDIDPTHVAEFQRVYGEGSAQVCDVSDPHQVDTAFAAFRTQHERLDVLVNNAGIAGPQGALEDIAVDDWQRTIDTDLNSLFYMTRHAIPLMRRSAVVPLSICPPMRVFQGARCARLMRHLSGRPLVSPRLGQWSWALGIFG